MGHLDDLAELLDLPCRGVSSKQILRWVDPHKGVALICTELIKYGTDGIKNPTGVTFAIGATVCNIFVIPIAMLVTKLFSGKS